MVEQRVNLDEVFATVPEKREHLGCGSCGSATDFGAEEGERQSTQPATAIRFGFMKYIGEFTHSAELKFTSGAKLVIQTRRGIEIGDQVPLTCRGCPQAVSREAVRAWIDACGKDAYIFDAGRILREATAADLAEYAWIQSSAREKLAFCQDVADRLGLALKVVECECLFGGERIIFYFTSEERVDFRDMVRDLAAEFRTRIEMRQVGARDEARLLADFETCGREICCKLYLKTLRPVTMKMAKLQKATLDPSKVSGRCGRLKCCLRYEHVGYQELDERLPRQGIRVRTEHGVGLIIGRQVLTQLLQIRLENDVLVAVPFDEVLEIDVPPTPPEELARLAKPAPSRRAAPPSEPKADREAAPKAGSEASGAEEDAQREARPRNRRRRGRRGRRSSNADSSPAGQDDKKEGAELPAAQATTGQNGQEGAGSERRRRPRGRRRRPRRSSGGSGDAGGASGGQGPNPPG